MSFYALPVNLHSLHKPIECANLLQGLDGQTYSRAQGDAIVLDTGNGEFNFRIHAHNHAWSGSNAPRRYYPDITEAEIIGHIQNDSGQTTTIMIEKVLNGPEYRLLSALVCYLPGLTIYMMCIE
jgi:hypothetical protein